MTATSHTANLFHGLFIVEQVLISFSPIQSQRQILLNRPDTQPMHTQIVSLLILLTIYQLTKKLRVFSKS